MGFIDKARGAAGTTIGCVGIILWFISGLVCFVWALYVMFEVFGVWTIFVGLFFFPITYIASIFIVWFSTGVFPIILLIPYVISFIGLALAAIGGKISGEDI